VRGNKGSTSDTFEGGGASGTATPLCAMLFILTALILGTIFDPEFLQGGIQDFGKTLSV